MIPTLVGVVMASIGAFSQAVHAAHASDDPLESWLTAHVSSSSQVMLGNIGPSSAFPSTDPGAVLASPSLTPYYRYHWIRDGALTMSTVLGLYERTQNPAEQTRYLNTLLAYADFSRRNQLTSNPSGPAGGLGLGEPKFNLDGTAFTGPWGRPQNDGPALRASVLTRLAHLLLDQGRGDLVAQKLYNAAVPPTSVIKADLEYVSHHWQDSSFDLWEEVRGSHFYTQMVQRRALVEGAALADRLGDSGAASFYRAQAQALEAEISRHWDASKGMIVVTLDRVEGHSEKTSGLDVAVVLGALHGAVHDTAQHGDLPDSFFSVTDDKVLATAAKIDQVFHEIYGINARTKDGDGLSVGNAIGRYPEDVYSGNGPLNVGNPWFLATNAFAELNYRAAQAFEKAGSVTISKLNAPFFKKLGRSFRIGEKVRAGSDSRFEALVQSLRDAGDSYLRRVKLHADPSGALSEQFDRDTGYMLSAAQLTWSHASMLTAEWAREISPTSAIVQGGVQADSSGGSR